MDRTIHFAAAALALALTIAAPATAQDGCGHVDDLGNGRARIENACNKAIAFSYCCNRTGHRNMCGGSMGEALIRPGGRQIVEVCDPGFDFDYRIRWGG